MAAIPTNELMPGVRSCHRTWEGHLQKDVAQGQASHARDYLAHCRAMYQNHMAEKHSLNGFMNLQGLSGDMVSGDMYSRYYPQGQPAPWEQGPGVTQLASPALARKAQEHQAAVAEVKQSQAQLDRVAKLDLLMRRKVAPGTRPEVAHAFLDKSDRNMHRCSKALKRCQARLQALQKGASPTQAKLAAVKAAPPEHPHDVEGLGFLVTPASGYAAQYQQVEQRPSWSATLPAQALAPGFAYRFPATETAFLDRKAQIQGGHGGVFAGELQAGIPATIHPLLAQLYPQLATQFATPWTNPWTYQQFFANTPRGMPIWGGGFVQPPSPPMVPTGPGAALAPTTVRGRYPTPGQAVERF